jgi:hypothetical protein
MQTSRPGLLALFHHYVHAWAHETSHALCITLSQRHPLHTTQSGQATLFITLSTYTHTTVQHQAESSCCCFSGREREGAKPSSISCCSLAWPRPVTSLSLCYIHTTSSQDEVLLNTTDRHHHALWITPTGSWLQRLLPRPPATSRRCRRRPSGRPHQRRAGPGRRIPHSTDHSDLSSCWDADPWACRPP